MRSEENCLDTMIKKTVIVNAMSSNHYPQSLNFIGSAQLNMPGTKIIVYDIGLNAEQVSELRTMCNVEVRYFNFSTYPEFMQPLKHFGWKPLIVKEVSLEHEIVVWADTSIRFKTSLKYHIFPYFLATNMTYIGIPHRSSANIVQFTHSQTVSYFNLTREMLTDFPQIQATFAIFWMKGEATTRIVNEWAKCATCEECIAPRGAVLGSGIDCLHKSKGAKGTEFVGCHRFDQSALGMIVYKIFGKGLAKIFTPIAYSTCEIRRSGDAIPRYNITQC